MEILHVFTFENRPNSLCMGILLIANLAVCQRTEECFFSGELSLTEAVERIHIFVRENSLHGHKVEFLVSVEMASCVHKVFDTGIFQVLAKR